MKRVRWNGAHFRVSNGEPECRLLFSEDHIDCEKHAEWREIESGTLDMESGKLRLVLKPVEKSFAEEMAEFFRRYWPLAWDGDDGGSFVRSAIAAVKRELANPAKLSENDGRIPQRLLDAIDPSAMDKGTRVVLLLRDGSWAVKDFPVGVDTDKVFLWMSPYVLESSGDQIKPKEAVQ